MPGSPLSPRLFARSRPEKIRPLSGHSSNNLASRTENSAVGQRKCRSSSDDRDDRGDGSRQCFVGSDLREEDIVRRRRHRPVGTDERIGRPREILGRSRNFRSEAPSGRGAVTAPSSLHQRHRRWRCSSANGSTCKGGLAGSCPSRPTQCASFTHWCLLGWATSFAWLNAIAVVKFAIVAALGLPLCWTLAYLIRSLPLARRVL